MLETYDDALNFIHGRQKWKKTNTFSRIARLLAELGNPQDTLEYVHITGTNGKGSVAKMVSEILATGGLQVGLFSSPFIMRFNERIQINGVPIPDADLLAIMQRVEPILARLDAELDEGGPTEFETLTALMFVYFSEQHVDVVVLEVGIGGTWDTTNIITDKIATVITTVAYDHMHVLGNTLGEIATQKAGIIKAGRPVIIGELPTEALQVIAAKTSKLVMFGKQFVTSNIRLDQTWGMTFDFSGNITVNDIHLDLMGAFQVDNAAVAIQTAELVGQHFGHVLTAAQIRQALAKVQWPARFERLQTQPLLIIDGAHNQAGIQALVATLRRDFSDRHIELFFGVLADKNYPQMLATLATLPNANLHVVGFDAPSSREMLDPATLIATNQEVAIQTHPTWQAGLASLPATTDQQAMIVMTGSLYFVSDVRQALMHKLVD